MDEFILKIEDIEPVLTDSQIRELSLATLDLFDGDWCTLLAAMRCTFNQNSDEIKNVIKKVKKLKNLCGPINNDRVSRWQRKYFDFQRSASKPMI